jgi:hypothetical protein
VKGSGRGLTLYRGIVLEGLRKTTKTVGQDSRCSGQDSNQSPHEHNSEALLLEQPLSHSRVPFYKAVPLKILCAGTVSQSERQIEGATRAGGSDNTSAQLWKCGPC